MFDITVSVNKVTRLVQSWGKQAQCPDMTHIQRTVNGSPVTGRHRRCRTGYQLPVTGPRTEVTNVTRNLLAFCLPIRTVIKTNDHRPQEVHYVG